MRLKGLGFALAFALGVAIGLSGCPNEVKHAPKGIKQPGRIVTGFSVCGFEAGDTGRAAVRFETEALGDGDVRASFYSKRSGALLTRLTIPQDISMEIEILEHGELLGSWHCKAVEPSPSPEPS